MAEKGRKRKLVFKVFLALHATLLAVIFSLALAALVAWKVAPVRSYVHSQLVKYYVHKVTPQLPFKIVSLDVDAKWRDFLKGHLDRLAARIDWEGHLIDLSGPIDFHFKELERERHIQATYVPTVQIDKIPPVPLSISFLAEQSFSHVDELNVHAHLNRWEDDEIHLKLEDFYFSANWDDGEANLNTSAKSIAYDESPEKKLNLSDFQFQANSALRFKPFLVGPHADFSFSAKTGRSTWDDQSFDLPLKYFPLHGDLTFDETNQDLDLQIGNRDSPTIAANIQARNRKLLRASWKTQYLSLPQLVSGVLNAIHQDLPDELQDIRKFSGTVRTEGSYSGKSRWKGKIVAKNLAFEWPENDLAASGLNLELPFDSVKGIDGKLSIDRILYRRLKAKLSPTLISLHPKDSARLQYDLKIGDPKGSFFPLKIEENSLKIGNVGGTFHLPYSRDPEVNYDVQTSVQLPPTPVLALAQSLCIDSQHLPPANVSIDFPKVDLTRDSVDPDGKARADLFGGFIEATDLGMYDMRSEVPELDFDLTMDGVRLDMLGDWTGFGEMDGILKGHAHDVTFQSWLPTHYDFGIEVKPYSHSKVVFSPDAMKNVARLIASDGVDNLPGIADWFAFGWPSRVFGGYDVFFAGISLFSSDGLILMTVLDPPDLPKSLSDIQRRDLIEEQKRRHYILNGYRFKIPLNTRRYPLIVDATAINNYLHKMTAHFSRLADAKKLKKGKNGHAQETPLDCSPPTL